MDACRLRLRPILMTSFAFILGVVPLVLAKGAGAEMRFTLGLAVFSGMLGVTIFGIFFTPIFYYVIRWFTAERASNDVTWRDQRDEPAGSRDPASRGHSPIHRVADFLVADRFARADDADQHVLLEDRVVAELPHQPEVLDFAGALDMDAGSGAGQHVVARRRFRSRRTR